MMVSHELHLQQLVFGDFKQSADHGRAHVTAGPAFLLKLDIMQEI